MSLTPRLLISLFLIQGGVVGVILAALACVVHRLERRLSASDLANRLDDLQRRQEAVESTIDELTNAKPADEAVSQAPFGPARRRFGPASRRVDPAAASAVPGPTLITVPSLATAAAPTTAAATDDLGQRFGPIWSLADAGASPDAIARSTGQPIGQVELILALRRQLTAHAGGAEPHLT